MEKYLDPDSKFFGNRILCREDIVPHFKNKLDAFLAHMPKSFEIQLSKIQSIGASQLSEHDVHLFGFILWRWMIFLWLGLIWQLAFQLGLSYPDLVETGRPHPRAIMYSACKGFS
ncbi:unnamed protein product [Dicrocoelium dendriticum]|nr:unnamed protein product [Dicrocoelium dendriticum]